MSRLFGTDGVRGEANVALQPELAYRLGRAATLYFGKRSEDKPKILIGRDTRISGEMFEAALTAGICSAGGRAVLAGIIPTPAVAYLVKKIDAAAGIVISASHNPFYDNGIKFFGGDGYKLPDAVEDEIENIVRQIESDDKFEKPTGAKIGDVEHRHDLLKDYIDFVTSTTTERFDGMKIALDCANGAAFEAMPAVLKNLGAEVIVMGDKPNGININDDCGSTHIENLRLEVLRKKADIGIGMGITGTEVVKKVADCILVDDSFSTIVDGVEEGRRITANIKKVILYLLAGNIVEVILVFASMLMNMEMFTTLQLLWINLVTDSIPAIMLAFEKCDKDVMDNTPANRSNSSFFTPFLTSKIVISAIIKSAVMIALFVYYAKTYDANTAGSLMFIFLIANELLYALSCRNLKRSVLNKDMFSNKRLSIGLGGLMLVQIIVLTTGLSKFFIVDNICYIFIDFKIYISIIIVLFNNIIFILIIYSI